MTESNKVKECIACDGHGFFNDDPNDICDVCDGCGRMSVNEYEEYLDALVDIGYFDAANGGDIWYECIQCRSNLVGSAYAICNECCGDD